MRMETAAGALTLLNKWLKKNTVSTTIFLASEIIQNRLVEVSQRLICTVFFPE